VVEESEPQVVVPGRRHCIVDGIPAGIAVEDKLAEVDNLLVDNSAEDKLHSVVVVVAERDKNLAEGLHSH